MSDPLAPPLTRIAPYAYTALRVLAGLLFLCHGIQKLTGELGGHEVPISSELGVGAIIEVVTGALIALGLGTRWAGLLASGQMAVAYVQFHWKLAIDVKFFPVVNGGELAILDCFVFLVIACYGGGLASLDGLLARRKA